MDRLVALLRVIRIRCRRSTLVYIKIRIAMRIIMCCCMLGAMMLLNACDSAPTIRGQLLKQTPIGSSFDQVLSYCTNQKLKCNSSTHAGFLNQDTGKVVGVNSIWAIIADKRGLPLTKVTYSAYWGFSADKQLIDIWVWRTVDAP